MAKAAVITGGTKGIGRGIGLRMAAAGYDIAVNYRRDVDGARKFASEIEKIGRRCVLVEADQTQDGAVDKLFDAARDAFGGLDLFVANAAATAFIPLLALKPHQIDKTLAVTVKSFLLGAQRAVPMMEGRKASIITISGMDTIHTIPFHALLGACKSALETLTKQLAAEVGHLGIRVNSVNPGFIDTDSTRFYAKDNFQNVVSGVEAIAPVPRIGTADDVAKAVEFLVSDAASYITGTVLHVDGGVQVAPLLMARMLNITSKE
jgi:enoyl-[acyl-carrier protein] reductase III